MFVKKILFIFIISLFYQSSLYSKSNSFEIFNSKSLSKYFSGIVAFENKDNLKALEFFNSSKILTNNHDPYLKRYIYSLVLENKVSQAINVVKNNKDKSNTNFFDANLLLVLDSLKKNDYKKAAADLKTTADFSKLDRFNSAILESLKQYAYVFSEKNKTQHSLKLKKAIIDYVTNVEPSLRVQDLSAGTILRIKGCGKIYSDAWIEIKNLIQKAENVNIG